MALMKATLCEKDKIYSHSLRWLLVSRNHHQVEGFENSKCEIMKYNAKFALKNEINDFY